jgi:hypothetical protein
MAATSRRQKTKKSAKSNYDNDEKGTFRKSRTSQRDGKQV